MASRGVATVPVFYVTEAGVVLNPLATAADDADKGWDNNHHGVEESRVRLANILRGRKRQQQKEKLKEEVQATTELQIINNGETADEGKEELNSKYCHENEAEDWEEDVDDVVECDRVVPTAVPSSTTTNYETDLAMRRVQVQHRTAGSLADREQQLQLNRLLARSARQSKNGGNTTKAIASQFAPQVRAADNAAARAVVHHAGSHYHMAGGVQFQRGVRVKGVVSRHSQQGARTQAARAAQRRGLEAREDARGARTAGAGRSKGKAAAGAGAAGGQE